MLPIPVPQVSESSISGGGDFVMTSPDPQSDQAQVPPCRQEAHITMWQSIYGPRRRPHLFTWLLTFMMLVLRRTEQGSSCRSGFCL